MSPLAIAKRLWRALTSLLSSLLAAVPPYRRIEGTLDAKEARPDGSFIILVASEIVEVDWLTFETLMIGEALRIRATRDNKAINIDRLMP